MARAELHLPDLRRRGNGQGDLMHKSLIVILLPLLLAVCGTLADGFFYSAQAQCAASDKIYIDPRLVPSGRKCRKSSIWPLCLATGLAPKRRLRYVSSSSSRVSPLWFRMVRARSWCTQTILVFSNIFREPLTLPLPLGL